MARKGQLTPIVIVLVGAAVVTAGGVAMMATGMGPFNSAGTGNNVDAPNAGGDDDSSGKLSMKAKDPLATSLNYTDVNYKVYNSDGVEVDSGTLGDSFTEVTLNENEDYTVRAYEDDDSGNDYLHGMKTETVPENDKPVIVDTPLEGTATTTVYESSGGTDDDGLLKIQKGATETAEIEIEENTQDARFRKPAVFIKDNNSAAIDEVSVKGMNDVTVEKVSEVPGRLSSYDDGYRLSVDAIDDFATESVQLQVKREGDNAEQAKVSYAVADMVMVEQNDGSWEEAFEDPDENDVGASDATGSVEVTN